MLQCDLVKGCFCCDRLSLFLCCQRKKLEKELFLSENLGSSHKKRKPPYEKRKPPYEKMAASHGKTTASHEKKAATFWKTAAPFRKISLTFWKISPPILWYGWSGDSPVAPVAFLVAHPVALFRGENAPEKI